MLTGGMQVVAVADVEVAVAAVDAVVSNHLLCPFVARMT
jgi:hypothetical protein